MITGGKLSPDKHDLSADKTGQTNGKWIPGHSGNPAGRPMGAKQKIANALVADLAEVWELRGKTALHRLAVDDPAAFARVAYGLLPKDVFISVEQKAPGNLDAESWAALRSLLDVIQRVGIEGEPQQLFEMIETDLRARLATDVSNPVSIEHSATDKADSDQ